VASSIQYSEISFVLTLLVLLLPLASFGISLITPQRYSWLISLNAPLLLLISASISGYLLFSGWDHEPKLFSVSWFTVGELPVRASFMLSRTSFLMLAVVSAVSFIVHVFSIGYMAGDAAVKRYFAMLGFFTFSMQGIVLADNLLLLFVFWELVGFSSYMLIGHWIEKPMAGRAAQKAFLINRIGDAGFLVGLMIIWAHTGSFGVGEILQSADSSWQTAASICIFCGVMGKSAQFPLLTWLPDAMEGPTPVSALIHAATMVAAGVYLMIRIFPLFTPASLLIVGVIGIITAVIGALAALHQTDIKKILAYSTISQLGLMTVALSSLRSSCRTCFF
jgi:NADH-quinone oxidoreductase subunit L